MYIHIHTHTHALCYLYIYLPTYLPTYLPIYLSVCLSIYLSIYGADLQVTDAVEVGRRAVDGCPDGALRTGRAENRP